MSETPAFPMAPVRFNGESREVDPGACFDWLRQGWAMFLVNPGVWIGSTVLLLVILMAISIVPLFGQIAAHLLVPLFGAGMIKLCRRLGLVKSLKLPTCLPDFAITPGNWSWSGFSSRSVYSVSPSLLSCW
jgi:hypothetical protein